MNQEVLAADLVKWLVDEGKAKLKKAYFIAANKYKLPNINGVRKEYQKIKRINKKQLTLF